MSARMLKLVTTWTRSAAKAAGRASRAETPTRAAEALMKRMVQGSSSVVASDSVGFGGTQRRGAALQAGAQAVVAAQQRGEQVGGTGQQDDRGGGGQAQIGRGSCREGV